MTIRQKFQDVILLKKTSTAATQRLPHLEGKDDDYENIENLKLHLLKIQKSCRTLQTWYRSPKRGNRSVKAITIGTEAERR